MVVVCSCRQYACFWECTRTGRGLGWGEGGGEFSWEKKRRAVKFLIE